MHSSPSTKFGPCSLRKVAGILCTRVLFEGQGMSGAGEGEHAGVADCGEEKKNWKENVLFSIIQRIWVTVSLSVFCRVVDSLPFTSVDRLDELIRCGALIYSSCRRDEKEIGYGGDVMGWEKKQQIQTINHDSWLWSAMRTSQIASLPLTFSLAPLSLSLSSVRLSFFHMCLDFWKAARRIVCFFQGGEKALAPKI